MSLDENQLYTAVCKKLIRQILGNINYSIKIHDGDRFLSDYISRDAREILDGMSHADEERIYVYEKSNYKGWILIVYSNDLDCIADYRGDLQDIIEPVSLWIETYRIKTKIQKTVSPKAINGYIVNDDI